MHNGMTLFVLSFPLKLICPILAGALSYLMSKKYGKGKLAHFLLPSSLLSLAVHLNPSSFCMPHRHAPLCSLGFSLRNILMPAQIPSCILALRIMLLMAVLCLCPHLEKNKIPLWLQWPSLFCHAQEHCSSLWLRCAWRGLMAPHHPDRRESDDTSQSCQNVSHRVNEKVNPKSGPELVVMPAGWGF